MDDDLDIDWFYFDFDKPVKQAGVVKAAPVLPDTCPKCGKGLGRGKHLHLKHCKGGRK